MFTLGPPVFAHWPLTSTPYSCACEITRFDYCVSTGFAEDGWHFAGDILSCIYLKKVIFWFKFHWSLFLKCNLLLVNIGSGNGLVPIRRQPITWTNNDTAHWCIHRSPSLDELSVVSAFPVRDNCCWTQPSRRFPSQAVSACLFWHAKRDVPLIRLRDQMPSQYPQMWEFTQIVGTILTHCGSATPHGVSDLHNYRLKKWDVTCSVQSQFQNQWWNGQVNP